MGHAFLENREFKEFQKKFKKSNFSQLLAGYWPCYKSCTSYPFPALLEKQRAFNKQSTCIRCMETFPVLSFWKLSICPECSYKVCRQCSGKLNEVNPGQCFVSEPTFVFTCQMDRVVFKSRTSNSISYFSGWSVRSVNLSVRNIVEIYAEMLSKPHHCPCPTVRY